MQSRRHRFDPWVGKMPCRRKWQPTPVFLPGESRGQRSLVAYSPWGRKESDTTEHACICYSQFNIIYWNHKPVFKSVFSDFCNCSKWSFRVSIETYSGWCCLLSPIIPVPKSLARNFYFFHKESFMRGFFHSPVVKTAHFHCMGHRFSPWPKN